MPPPPPRNPPGPPPFQPTTPRPRSPSPSPSPERHVKPVESSLAPLGKLGYHFNAASLELFIYLTHDEQKLLSRYLDRPDWYYADDIKPLSLLQLGSKHPITVTCDQGFTEAISQLKESMTRISVREKTLTNDYQKTLVTWGIFLIVGEECVLRHEWKNVDLATGILDFESFELFQLRPGHTFTDKFGLGDFTTGQYTLKPKAAPTNTSEEDWVVTTEGIDALDLKPGDVKS
jgi:hypothetical protein